MSLKCYTSKQNYNFTIEASRNENIIYSIFITYLRSSTGGVANTVLALIREEVGLNAAR